MFGTNQPEGLLPEGDQPDPCGLARHDKGTCR